MSQLFGDKFATKSIGKEGHRRLVLYLKSVGASQLSMSQPKTSDSDEALKEASTDDEITKTKNCTKKHKRPDKQLYIPPRSKTVKPGECHMASNHVASRVMDKTRT